MQDIITIGSATRDVFLLSKEIQLFPSEKFITGVGECVALGTKIDLDEMVMTTGGGATNAAVTFANLGFKTNIVTRLGDDSAGQDIIQELKALKINTKLINKIKGGQTDYSTLLTEPKGGERTALVYRGVSSAFSEADIPFQKITNPWIYLTSLAGNIKLATKIISRLGSKTRIVWNPGSSEIKAGLMAFKPLFAKLFLLNMNREEATLLFTKDPIEHPEVLQTLPLTLTVVITDGARGAYAYLDGTCWFAKSQNIKAKSRTGAGDAFGSGVVAGLMKGLGLDDALRLGMLNAQSVIQSIGAKAGILTAWPKKKSLESINVSVL